MLRQSEPTNKVVPPVELAPEDLKWDMNYAAPSPLPFASSRPEVQLLLACSRLHVDEGTAASIKALVAGEIDWEYVLRTASEHRVTSLTWRSLNSVKPEGVPAEINARLRRSAADNALFNLYRTRELIKLLAVFDAHSIPCFPFKGSILSARVYHNLALREYSDLDILIHPSDVLRTRDLLLEQGYRLWSPPNRHHKSRRFSHRNKDLIFESGNGQIMVELHWRLSGSHFTFPLDMEGLWERLEITSLAGAKVRTLALEDLLLYLCMHGSRHGWERLLWICDIAEIVRQHPEMNWRHVREVAHALGCERMLGLGLLLAREILGAKLPEEEWQRITVDETVKSLAVQVERLLFDRSDASSGISYWNDLHLRVRERASDRLRLRLHYYRRHLREAVVPNERDRAIMPLPDFLFSLYYLLRPIRLMKAFGLTTLKKLTKLFRYS
jgi:hypothetical protein